MIGSCHSPNQKDQDNAFLPGTFLGPGISVFWHLMRPMWRLARGLHPAPHTMCSSDRTVMTVVNEETRKVTQGCGYRRL